MLGFEWCKAHRKEILIMTVIVLLLSAMQWRSQHSAMEGYVKADGRIVGLERQSLEEEELFPLILEIEQDGEKETYEVTITLEGQEVEESATSEDDFDENPLQDQVDQLIASIEDERGKRISLPSVLSDGTPVSWSMAEDNYSFMILLLLPCMIYFLYRSEIEKERKQFQRLEESIRKSLPAFNDQLLLLLNCGLIFHDAFYRIGISYEGRRTKDDFCLFLKGVRRDVEEGGESIVTALKRRSQQTGVRELSRVVNIIEDNQHRGVGLKDKLESESRILWEERKMMALQKGKEVETKLTLPLVLLLLVLMMITGVPAMMNM